MITARIHTQIRIIDVPCENDKDKAISALQKAVYQLTVEDGRCWFVVNNCGHEIYSWSYQPTFREEKKKKTVKKESKYVVGLIVYILLNGEELSYDNFYDDGTYFDTVAKAREFMKERGYGKYDYQVVYEYTVSSRDGNNDYGFGLGFTKAEAKEQLNRNLKYYNLEVKPNGTIKEI